MDKMTIEDIVKATECSYEEVVVDPGIIQLLDALEIMFDRDMEDAYDDVYDNPRVAHFLYGFDTEVAEIRDIYKRIWFYRKGELDVTHLFEEVFDTLYYVCMAELELGRVFYGTRDILDKLVKLYDGTLDDCIIRGGNKLKKRYPNGFDTGKALNRDLETERKALEEGV